MPSIAMIFSCIMSRERAAQLQTDPDWAVAVSAWRAWGLTQDPSRVVVYGQTSYSILDVRTHFMLPRLHACSFDNMLEMVLNRHGLIFDCVFSGGEFRRMLARSAARSLLPSFQQVAAESAGSVVHDFIDLTADETPLSVSVIPGTD